MGDPLQLLALEHGVVLRREAVALGYDDKALALAVREGQLVRVRHGVYCPSDIWLGAGPAERHMIRARAVLRTTPGPVALTHVSALVAHGVEVWGADLDTVHVTRLDAGASRIAPGVRHHVGALPASDLTDVEGMCVSAPARATVEAMSVLGSESALVSADSALHQRLCEADDLWRVHRRLEGWPWLQRARVVLALADGGAASVGESRSRHLFWWAGLPRPILQYEVRSPSGQLLGITDFAWPQHRLLGEFDGRIKYAALLRPGETASDAVFREKQREDRLREATGFAMCRLTWQDLEDPRRTAHRFAHQLGLVA